MSNFIVRQAVLADLEDVAELFDEYRQFYGQPGDLRAARNFLLERANHGDSVVFVARDDSRALGFAQLFPAFSSVSLARTFILNDLYVCPAGRRRGVARHLLSSAEAYGRSLGALRLTLSTAHDNTEAQALYRASGWKQDDQYCVFHRTLKPE